MSEEEYIEECERKYIERHTTHIKGYTEEYVNNLQQKVEKLENIRKEVIKYIEKEIKDMPLNGCKLRLIDLLNILNKGNDK